MPDYLFFLRNYIWDFALSKLYSNSLLSTLNARGGWRTTFTNRDNVLFGTTATAAENVINSLNKQVLLLRRRLPTLDEHF